jgi:hypothetical protein
VPSTIVASPSLRPLFQLNRHYPLYIPFTCFLSDTYQKSLITLSLISDIVILAFTITSLVVQYLVSRPRKLNFAHYSTDLQRTLQLCSNAFFIILIAPSYLIFANLERVGPISQRLRTENSA